MPFYCTYSTSFLYMKGKPRKICKKWIKGVMPQLIIQWQTNRDVWHLLYKHLFYWEKRFCANVLHWCLERRKGAVAKTMGSWHYCLRVACRVQGLGYIRATIMSELQSIGPCVCSRVQSWAITVEKERQRERKRCWVSSTYRLQVECSWVECRHQQCEWFGLAIFIHNSILSWNF